ncbi:Uncharacterised protein [uncultured archaeon]|nr:Uncharacterised protein [uncultured archaeon]
MKKLVILFLILAIYFPFISAGNYGAGIYSQGVYGVGQIIPTPTPSPGGAGGGGGVGPSCSYNWSCTNWFPLECPASGNQERICVNRGTCTDTLGMPEQIRNCTYEHKEPLFDIFLKLPNSAKKTCAGKDINANVELKNYGKIELLDAFMSYWIVNENNTLISELKDTRSVVNRLNFDVSLKIPESAPNGIYRVYAQITYSGNKTAVAGESFELNPDYCKFESAFQALIPFIIIGIVLIVILVLIIILFIKLKKHLEKVEEKNKRRIKEKPAKQKANLFQKIKKIIKKIKKKREERKILKDIEKQKRIAENEKKQLHEKNKHRRELEERKEEIAKTKSKVRKSFKSLKLILQKINPAPGIREAFRKYKRKRKEKNILREAEKQKRAEEKKIRTDLENKRKLELEKKKEEIKLKQKAELSAKREIESIKPVKEKVITKPVSEFKEKIEKIKPVFDEQEKIKRKKIERKYRKQILEQLKSKKIK